MTSEARTAVALVGVFYLLYFAIALAFPRRRNHWRR